MKLYCLSGDPAKPCYVVSFKELLIMLDCGLSAQSVLNFLPLPLVQSSKLANLANWIPSREHDPQMDGELKECCGRVFVDSAPEFSLPLDRLIDFSEIDVILISNYLNMLALPYITEGTDFKGTVYATEPTLQIGQFFMEELVEYIEAVPKPNNANLWKDMLQILPSPLCDLYKPKKWRKIFSLDDVKKALSRVKIAGYDEKLDIFGALQVTPVSSGYCLGSSNWVLSTGHEKICYVSGSSTLTTHPRPINQTVLKHADVVILTGLTQAPHVNPDTMLGELCMNVAVTLRNNGSVLIPCYPSGVVYDLFECLSTNLDNAGLTNIPMFFISPVADSSLAYSNILAEWLSSVKQNKVYIPDDPFPHAFLVKNARLKHYKRIYSEGFSTDFRQPCVVFCGHPSLRFGDVVHFIELWGNNPQHTIIFTEPDYPYLQALAPYQPLAMKAIYCPIETSLNFQQANKLVKELKPNVLVIPESYTHPPQMAPHKLDLVIDQTPDRKIITFKFGEYVKLPLKRKKNRVYLSSDLADSIVPKEIIPGTNFSTVTGILHVKDNVHNIKPIEDEKTEPSSSSSNTYPPSKEQTLKKAKYEFGSLDVDLFVKKLIQDGITDVKVEQGGNGSVTIFIPSEDTKIEITLKSTHIICGGKQSLRLKLRDLLLKCIQTF
ncbi:integrator complex subunit 9 [Condylostylus longicornis]|uniref:integrator complex subunit 9 n=1 Tax=Condylostylus longicornis TaxID=2530218 RepID=UPI00244DF8A9|nr:integrator complex subunit 9 [Condylostylus longicornis]